ncbi:hypothetical protein E4U30_006093 [Claviceps sp. LM220 group G6]|nr:hypothetical protein E4U30_006093 [Claviceps sp. LM220 group G6]
MAYTSSNRCGQRGSSPIFRAMDEDADKRDRTMAFLPTSLQKQAETGTNDERGRRRTPNLLCALPPLHYIF